LSPRARLTAPQAGYIYNLSTYLSTYGEVSAINMLQPMKVAILPYIRVIGAERQGCGLLLE